MSCRHKQIQLAHTICMTAHAGQVDKMGVPYHHHPTCVANMVEGATAKCVAYLHDVLEDTTMTPSDLLAQGVLPKIVNAVECLTRQTGETYGDYIARVKKHPVARQVKLADLAHNLHPSRSAGLSDSLRARYKKAYATLIATNEHTKEVNSNA